MKTVGIIAWLVLSGYITWLAFKGMNMPNDLTYVGGILGLAGWFCIVTPYLYKKFYHKSNKKLYKEIQKEYESNAESTRSSSPVSDSNHSNDVMHDKDRPGDGGNRSGSVGQSAGSAGHRPEDGKGVV